MLKHVCKPTETADHYNWLTTIIKWNFVNMWKIQKWGRAKKEQKRGNIYHTVVDAIHTQIKSFWNDRQLYRVQNPSKNIWNNSKYFIWFICWHLQCIHFNPDMIDTVESCGCETKNEWFIFALFHSIVFLHCCPSLDTISSQFLVHLQFG